MYRFCGVLALALPIAFAASPSCKSSSGKNVDFAYSFKYPDGWDYAYMDAENHLSKASDALNSDTSSITQTLLQIHDAGTSFVAWNDQTPGGKKTGSPDAHAKGVLAFTSTGGFWLTHSLPLFPNDKSRSGTGLWTAGSSDNGQSFLCITLSADDIHSLSPAMQITQPNVYYSNFATGATTTFADIKAWAIDKVVDKDTMTTSVAIKSKAGQSFHFYAKSGLWGSGKDLYRDLVAPALGAIYVEGWRKGHGPWGPACGKDKVLDVSGVAFPDKTWDTMQDHSKWVVSETSTGFCVGDINRMDGQDGRGGGTVCIHDSSFAGQMRKTITGSDKCSGRTESIVV